MQKNKILFSFIIILLTLFLKVDVTKAVIYNGGANNMSSGTGSSTCNFTSGNKQICPWSSGTYKTVKISIWFINDGEFVAIKGKETAVYWTNNKNYIEGDYSIENFEMAPSYEKDGKTVSVISSNSTWKEINENIIEYFGLKKDKYIKEPSTEMKDFFKELMGADWKEQFDGEGKIGDSLIVSQEQNPKNAATYGYRIIIEPVFNYIVHDSNNKETNELLTVKEIAKKVTVNGYSNMCTIGSTGVCVNAFGSFNNGAGYAAALTVDFKDVGINKGTAKSFDSNHENACILINETEKEDFYKEVAKDTNGCGYNIIDITNYTDSYKCYNPKKTGNLECENTDKNNWSDFKVNYKAETCTKEDAETNTNSKYGERISYNSNCTLYCIESAFASFPGNVSGELPIDILSSRGTYFTWPSRIEPGMTMLMRSQLSCRIVQKKGKKCSKENIEDLKGKAVSEIQSMKLEASLKAGTNKEINGKLTSYNVKYKNDVSNIKLNEKGISNEFSLTKESYFKIPENKNRLYNRKSGNVFDGISSTSNDVFDRGEGVISLKKDDDISKIYDLEIYDVKLGSGVFDELISNYVCHYQLKIDDCVCPEGTLRAGESLYKELVSGKSCTELQNTLCNICQCPPNSSNEYEIIKIGEDATTEVCQSLQQKQCYSNYCTYNGKKINLDECIKTQMEENELSKEQANIYCDEKLCPKCIDKNGTEVDISACLETGNSYTICENLYCKKRVCVDNKCYECSENCSWKLVKKSKTSIEYQKKCSDGENCDYIKLSCPGGDDNMNSADDCIKNKLSKKLNGNSITAGLNEKLITNNDVRWAFAACESEVCPYSGSKIIYRQIDLNDPFPGKKHEGTNTNDKLNLSNNNQTIRTRKPGENWNSETVIQTKILNARGVKGYEIYNKDPLYIIKLTPDIIKKIREYNKKNSYDDFNLNCTNNEKTAACISDFLHKQGTIDNLNPSDFIKNKYENKNSVSNCYNMSYDELSFNNCYNKDN